MTPEELTELLTRACSEVASALPGFESEGPSEYNPLPEVHFFAEVGTVVPLAALKEMGVGDDFEQGDEIGLQAFPVDELTVRRFQAAGLGSELEAAHDELRVLLGARLIELTGNEEPDETRRLAASIARQLGV